MRSRLIPGAQNIFAKIKADKANLLNQGAKILDFSVGIPPGASSRIATSFGALAHLLNEQGLAGYQDCGSAGVDTFLDLLEGIDLTLILKRMKSNQPMERLKAVGKLLDVMCNRRPDKKGNNFSEEFCRHHLPKKTNLQGLAFAPTIGTKSMLDQVILACGTQNAVIVAMMTDPGYPTPAFWGEKLKNVYAYQLPLNPGNDFKVTPEMIPPETNLLMLQYPNNPTGQIKTWEDLIPVCQFCADNGIRVVNDNPYSLMAPPESVTLTEVAVTIPGCEFIEAFSFSKEGGNHTGWGVGAVVGTEAFIDDFKRMKGEGDSGFNVPAAIGAIATLRYDNEHIKHMWDVFRDRQSFVRQILSGSGLRPVGTPLATFFSLWEAPKNAFGRKILDGDLGGNDFYNALVKETGIITVPFKQYIRLAVISNGLDHVAFREDFCEGAEKIQPQY